MKLGAEQFFDLERRLIGGGHDADLDSFATIRERLKTGTRFDADEFARQAAYVVLAGGFSQKTAKKIHAGIMDALRAGGTADDLLKLFNNKNKINAIAKLWENRARYRDGYYELAGAPLDEKLKYLSSLPHIGKITANHLARNLGENIVKYDIWIQRLAAAGTEDGPLIDNGNLRPEVKKRCDEMFAELESATGLPRGYIDVVLWKSCQVGLLELAGARSI
ncbi:MAG: hypothetical protein LBT45_01760 [Rickettsiales bacterium]|jgi:hypothetical protein|nr:hypothetical protein [Rickettsiales bacterium]